MNTRIISPKNSVIDEIIPTLEVSGMDYSSNLVVFPGKRPSHFLRKEIAERNRKSFIPPISLSMDEFVDYIFESIKADKKLETIDAIYILYEIHKNASLPLGGDRFSTPDEFFPIGLRIYKDLEELYIEEVSVNQLKNVEFYATETIPSNSLNRSQSLSYFYEGFYRKIEELSLSTRASRYRIVSDEIDEAVLNKFQKIIFAGFFALTGSEKRLFKKLFSLDNTLFFFQEGTGLEEKLKDSGITLNNNEKSENNYPETYFYSSPDTHGEIYAASNILKDKSLNTKTVIVLPSSETLFSLVRQGLTFVDEDEYNVSTGYPLYRTPIFGFMNNLMELITSMDGELIYIPYYLRFMLHPYTKNIYFKGNAEITRIILHALEDELTKRRTRTFLTLSEIEENIYHLIDKVSDYEIRINIKEHLRSIHHNTIEKFISFNNIRDFTMKCKEVLTYIYNNSTARLHPLFYPFSEAFIKHMDVLGQSLMKEISFEKMPTYFTFFRKYIMNFRLPFEGTPLKGLQILGFLETRNIKFDRVFFFDANEEIIPDAKNEDSLLPLKVKEMLGIPTYSDRDKLMAYYFDILIKGAKEVHLFFIENDKKERSRFVERLLWERQKKDIKTDAKDYMKPVKYRVSLVNKIPEEIEKTDKVARFLRDFSYNPSALDDYLKCPLKFYYSRVLKLEKKEEVTGDIERRDIGEIVHDALKQYFSKRTGRVLKEKDIDTHEMDNLVNKIFEKEYGSNITGAIYLLRRQIKNRLKETLELYYKPLIKNKTLSILNVEKEIILKKDVFKLKGRIDSIEKRDNKIFILDYKTSSNGNKLRIRLDKLNFDKRETWSDAIGSLQIPFYLMLFLEKGKKIKKMRGVYLLLGRSMIGMDIEIPPFEDSETERAMNILKKIIINLLREIVDPSIPFIPAKDIKNICPSCIFRYICGTQWVRR